MKQDVRVAFLDFLPKILSGSASDGRSNQMKEFLSAFERVFEELEAEMEGGPLRLKVEKVDSEGQIGDTCREGGIPDLFDPAVTPPWQFKYRDTSCDFTYLQYLAGLVGLELREDVPDPVAWNRRFIKDLTAWHTQNNVALFQMRGTQGYLEYLLHQWLVDELYDPQDQLIYIGEEGDDKLDPSDVPQLVFETDKISSVFCDIRKNYFYIFIDVKKEVADRVESIQESVRLLVNREKPAHVTYALLVKAKES